MDIEIRQRIEQINRGEVPEGYVRSTAGIIPKDWDVVPLSTLLDFKNGINADKEKYGTGVKMISVMDILKDTPLYYEDIVGKVDIDATTLSTYSVTYGDILFQRSSETVEDAGKSNVYMDIEHTATYSGFVIRGKKKTDYCPYFLNEALKKEAVRKQIIRSAAGSQHINIGQDALEKIKVCIPSKSKQEKIVAVLLKWDEAISLYKRQINALEEYKRTCFSKMFPQKNKAVPEWRFEGCFGNWEYKRLGDISNSFSGGTPRVGVPEFYGGRIPFIRSAEINSDTTELSITELGLNNSSARFVSKGDILFALYGATSGEVGRSKINGAINQAILAIKPLDSYDSEFIMQWLRKNKQNIIDTYLQGGQGNLSGTIVKNIPIAVPSLMEQLKIGSFFAHLDTLIALYRNKQEKVIIQKEIIQGFLLNGIVRV